MVDTRQKRKKLTEEAIAAKKKADAEAFERLVLEEEWRDWCSPLIEDLLPSIVSFLVTLADFSSFGAVCRKWRSSSSGVSRLTMSSQSPLLLLRRKGFSSGIISEYFFDATHHRIYKPPLLPWGIHIRHCRIFGYTHGHLVLVADTWKPSISIILFNVFTGNGIKLPPTHNFSPHHLLLSSSPSSPGCIAVLLGCPGSPRCFLYCRPCDSNWTRYQLPPPHSVEDVIFVDNKLYALTTDGRLGFFSFVPHPIFTMLEENFVNVEAHCTWRLAESAGDLLVIIRRSFSYEGGYDIWRRELEGGCGFVKISSLGGRALFFANRRFAGSLLASVRSGVTGNSIYQIDGGDYWVYSFDAKTIIDRFSKFPELDYSFLPLSLWILPNLC